MKRTLITNIGMLATPQGTSARGGRAQGRDLHSEKRMDIH